ncbi:MAG: hypothetical protein NT005_05825, partial [Spirochaetes bacterium]|nr:hypothetical protein [Spirochaetota bacterium]
MKGEVARATVRQSSAPSKRRERRTTDDPGAARQGALGWTFWAFCQAFVDKVVLPCDGFVIGEPVSVIQFDYDGNARRGLTARCRREDGAEYVVAALDVVFPSGSKGARYLAAYRKWLGLEPFLPDAGAPPRRARQHKVEAADLDMSGPVELVVLAVKGNAVRCRLLGADRV